MTYEELWEIKYNLAKAYFNRYKNLKISFGFKTYDGITPSVDDNATTLGIWIYDQRVAYKNKKLSPDRIEKLNKIGMKWSINFTWEDSFELAKIYYKAYHNLLIPAKFRTYDGYTRTDDKDAYRLGEWIVFQRKHYKSGKLNESQIKQLETIGMVWNTEKNIMKEVRDLKWEKHYTLVVRYAIQNPNKYLLIPENYYLEINGETINLGLWISEQRIAYRKNKLSLDRIKKLEMLGMVWGEKKIDNSQFPKVASLTHEKNWLKMYKYASEYSIFKGDLLVKSDYSFINKDGKTINLGHWISKQRQKYKEGTLSKDHEDLLNTIDMVWSIRKKRK